MKLPKSEGEGIVYPDQHGHFRRTNSVSPDFNQVNYYRAQARNRNDHKRRMSFIDGLYHDMETWKDTISPLQRLSYAFHYGGWEAVKQAAYNLAYSEAISNRLDDMNIPDIIRDALHLDQMLKELAGDIRQVTIDQDRSALIEYVKQLDIQDKLDEFLNQEGGDDNELSGTEGTKAPD